MKKDYRFLIGQRFAFGGVTYVVQDLTTCDERTFVQAIASEETLENGFAGVVGSDVAFPQASANPVAVDADAPSETFSLSDVIQWLLVDEEIVLFNPNYLSAR